MVVLHHKDRFLLLKRARPPHVGKYVPVGGKLEPFEHPHQAAIRETKEETGLDVSDLRFGGVLVETAPIDYNWQCHIYVAEIDDVPPPPCDEGVLEWIAIDRLKEIPTPPTDYLIYQYLLRHQPFAFNALYDDQLNLVWMWEEMEGVKVY